GAGTALIGGVVLFAIEPEFGGIFLAFLILAYFVAFITSIPVAVRMILLLRRWRSALSDERRRTLPHERWTGRGLAWLALAALLDGIIGLAGGAALFTPEIARAVLRSVAIVGLFQAERQNKASLGPERAVDPVVRFAALAWCIAPVLFALSVSTWLTQPAIG